MNREEIIFWNSYLNNEGLLQKARGTLWIFVSYLTFLKKADLQELIEKI